MQNSKLIKKEILASVNDDYVVFNDIDWDTDGEKVKLPKTVRVPKKEFEEDFDFSLEGANYLSDKFGWCVNSFSFKME